MFANTMIGVICGWCDGKVWCKCMTDLSIMVHGNMQDMAHDVVMCALCGKSKDAWQYLADAACQDALSDVWC